MEHPWRRFRDRPDWLLMWGSLPAGQWGESDHETKTVMLDRSLTQAQRRCTIAHELEHIYRGPVPDDPILEAREEAAIDRIVARKLIPIRDLGEAMAWAHTVTEVAEELWVDEPTLLTRLAHLHPAERAYLQQRTEHR